MKKFIALILVLLMVATGSFVANAETEQDSSSQIFYAQNTWQDGAKYLLIAPSCANEGYNGKGILFTNTLAYNSHTSANVINSVKLDDYDASSLNSLQEFNALESFETSQDLSQYYMTAEEYEVDSEIYFAFKTTDGKYLAAGPQAGRSSQDWNRTYLSDEINDDTLFTGEYRIDIEGDKYVGNNAFIVTSKSGFRFRVMNSGNIVCKNGEDYYQSFIGFYSTSKVATGSVNVSIQALSGAALRLVRAGKNGVRFYTKVDAERVKKMQEKGYEIELGTIISSLDLLEDKELTFESGIKVIDVKYTAKDSDGNFIYYQDGDTFVGSISNIKEDNTTWSATSGNITREFVGRGYIKLTKDDETTILYANYTDDDINNHARSLQYIANAYKQDETSNYSSLGDDFKVLVDKWASSVR